MQASVHAPYVFACTGPYLSQIESDQKEEGIYESGEHTKPILVYNTTQAQKLACMHAMCLRAWAHISAKF